MGILEDMWNVRQRDLPSRRGASGDYGGPILPPAGGPPPAPSEAPSGTDVYGSSGVDPVYGQAGATGGFEGTGATGTWDTPSGRSHGITGTWDAPGPTAPYRDIDGMIIDHTASLGQGIGRTLDAGVGAVGSAAGAVAGGVGYGVDTINSWLRPDSPSAQTFRAQQNAAVSPELAVPRGGDNAPGTPATWAHRSAMPANGWGASAQVPAQPQRQPGPLETASRSTAIDQQLRDNQAELGAYNARGRADQQDQTRSMVAGGRLMTSAYDLEQAKKAENFARFRAQNGADMVLAPENSGYDTQRRAIVDNWIKARDDRVAAQGENKAAQDGLTGNRNYIDEYAKSQEAANRTKLADRVVAGSDVETQGKQLDVNAKQEEAKIRAQLQTETDPGKVKMLQNKLLAMMGKQPANRVAVVDVDTGQKDFMGQPIFKKQAIDIETGNLVGNGPTGGAGASRTPPPEAIALLKSDPSKAALFEQHYGLPKGSAAQYLK